MDANANYLRHSLETCVCTECQEASHLKVSNTIIQPTEFFLKVEPAILELKDPELTIFTKQIVSKQKTHLLLIY